MSQSHTQIPKCIQPDSDVEANTVYLYYHADTDSTTLMQMAWIICVCIEKAYLQCSSVIKKGTGI